jgi:hypothetical protein
MAQKALTDFLFGLFFGIGFAIAFNILSIIAALLHAPALLR